MTTTQVALELLTQSHDNLTLFLAGLGLSGNESAVIELKTKFDRAFQGFLEQYNTITNTVSVKASEIEQMSQKAALAQEDQRVENDRLQFLLNNKSTVSRWKSFCPIAIAK